MKLDVLEYDIQYFLAKNTVFYVLRIPSLTFTFSVHNFDWLFVIVVVAHIYPPVTRQRQTLNIERSAHFLLQ